MIRAVLLSLVLAVSAIGQPIPTIVPASLALAFVRTPQTNTFSLYFTWLLPAGFTITNTTFWNSNQFGAITFTNMGPGTNGVVMGLSYTNRYHFWATATDTNGLTSERSNVVQWRPPLTWVLTVSTVPVGPSFSLTNPPVAKFFRLKSAGTVGSFESAATPRGPWSSFKGPFSVTAGLSYRLTASLSNDFTTVMASEKRD